MLVVGQVFYEIDDIKAAVLDHALTHSRNIKHTRYDKTKLGFRCVGQNCEWRIWFAIRSYGNKWEVMMFNDKHGCVPNGKCNMLKIPVIAQLFMHKIRDETSYYMPMKIEEIIKEKWKICVSRDQCQKARIMALKWIEELYNEQFKRLSDYASELKESNPNSTVDVDTYRNGEGFEIFNRFYVCYDVLRRSFKNHCRRVIGVDGCFLKGRMKGILLVALGRDGDNSIFPVAWAIVQKEDTPNWLWFFQKLKVDLDLLDGRGYVLISDRQKGLCNAAEIVLPNIEHRMCVRHIYSNLKTKHGKKPELKPLVWQLGWSYNEVEYNEDLRKIYRYDSQVYADVLDKKPRTWCRAFYSIGSCCEDVDNNSTESFNATIVRAREMPLIPLLELISRQAMVRIITRSLKATKHTGRCTPYAQECLDELLPKASECTVWPSTNQMYLVQAPDCSYRVSLARKTCTCRKWDIRGIPCEHAYSVMINKNLQVEDYVEIWFTKTNWMQTYEEGIVPPRGAKFWPRNYGPAIHRPPSPVLPGRKKKTVAKKQNRKKGVNESPTKKATKVSTRTMHCHICGAANHNSRFHKRKCLTSLTQEDGSQSQGDASVSQPHLQLGDVSVSQPQLQLGDVSVSQP